MGEKAKARRARMPKREKERADENRTRAMGELRLGSGMKVDPKI